MAVPEKECIERASDSGYYVIYGRDLHSNIDWAETARGSPSPSPKIPDSPGTPWYAHRRQPTLIYLKPFLRTNQRVSSGGRGGDHGSMYKSFSSTAVSHRAADIHAAKCGVYHSLLAVPFTNRALNSEYTDHALLRQLKRWSWPFSINLRALDCVGFSTAAVTSPSRAIHGTAHKYYTVHYGVEARLTCFLCGVGQMPSNPQTHNLMSRAAS